MHDPVILGLRREILKDRLSNTNPSSQEFKKLNDQLMDLEQHILNY